VRETIRTGTTLFGKKRKSLRLGGRKKKAFSGIDAGGERNALCLTGGRGRMSRGKGGPGRLG